MEDLITRLADVYITNKKNGGINHGREWVPHFEYFLGERVPGVQPSKRTKGL